MQRDRGDLIVQIRLLIHRVLQALLVGLGHQLVQVLLILGLEADEVLTDEVPLACQLVVLQAEVCHRVGRLRCLLARGKTSVGDDVQRVVMVATILLGGVGVGCVGVLGHGVLSCW